MTLRYVDEFPIDVHLRVLRAYLFDGMSHRSIQREILRRPAKANGGGFMAMNILHHYAVHEKEKSLLARTSLADALRTAEGPLLEALQLLAKADDFETVVSQKVRGEVDYSLPDGPTELTSETKRRIGQSALRAIVIADYGGCCALCPVALSELLICGHIVPWSIDLDRRLDPRNAIALCVWHDKLFEEGFFSFDSEMRIITNETAPAYIRDSLVHLQFRKPTDYAPAPASLEYHRENIFRSRAAGTSDNKAESARQA